MRTSRVEVSTSETRDPSDDRGHHICGRRHVITYLSRGSISADQVKAYATFLVPAGSAQGVVFRAGTTVALNA